MQLFILHKRVLQGLHALQFLLGVVCWFEIQTPSLFYHPAMFCTLNYRTFLIVRLVLHNKKGARMRRRFRVQTIYEVLWPIAYFIRTTVALNTRIRECHFTRKKVSRPNLILSILVNIFLFNLLFISAYCISLNKGLGFVKYLKYNCGKNMITRRL